MFFPIKGIEKIRKQKISSSIAIFRSKFHLTFFYLSEAVNKLCRLCRKEDTHSVVDLFCAPWLCCGLLDPSREPYGARLIVPIGGDETLEEFYLCGVLSHFCQYSPGRSLWIKRYKTCALPGRRFCIVLNAVTGWSCRNHAVLLEEYRNRGHFIFHKRYLSKKYCIHVTSIHAPCHIIHVHVT